MNGNFCFTIRKDNKRKIIDESDQQRKQNLSGNAKVVLYVLHI